MADKKANVHVVPHPDGGWATRREGSERVSGRHDTQQQAIDAGRPAAKRDQVEFFVHGRDGQIRERDSYGNDPFPPKG